MMIRPPAVLLESWSNHRSLKLRHWVSFAQHGTASLGRFTEQNDVVIPDHSVSGEHALIVCENGEFWLHDRESSNGSFIRLCAPLRLGFGESLHLKMGKSLLCLQAKRSRWWRIRMRLVSFPKPTGLVYAFLSRSKAAEADMQLVCSVRSHRLIMPLYRTYCDQATNEIRMSGRPSTDQLARVLAIRPLALMKTLRNHLQSIDRPRRASLSSHCALKHVNVMRRGGVDRRVLSQRCRRDVAEMSQRYRGVAEMSEGSL